MPRTSDKLRFKFKKTVFVKSEADFPLLNGSSQHPLEEGTCYRIDGEVSCENNFLLPPNGSCFLYGDTVNNKLTYTGGGTMFLQPAHTGGVLGFFDLSLDGNTTAQWLNISDTTAETEVIWSRCNVENFDSLGTLNVGSIAGDFTSHLIYNSPLDVTVKSDTYMSGCIFFSGGASDGLILRMGDNTIGQIIDNTPFMDFGEYFLNIPSTLNNFRLSVAGNLVPDGGGALFNIAGLNNEDPRIESTGNLGFPDSDIIGSFIWSRNAVETNIVYQGLDGSILSFADSGGGATVVTTSALHGLISGQYVSISNNSGYDGYHLISDASGSSFTIPVAFNGAGTGLWSSGWEKVAGTTIPAVNERCSMTNNNELTFTNLANHRGLATVGMTVLRGDGASTPSFDFILFKDGKPDLIGGKEVIAREDTNTTTPRSVTFSPPTFMKSGNVFSIYARNTTNTSNILISDGQLTIT